jgi:hypothetical protein
VVESVPRTLASLVAVLGGEGTAMTPDQEHYIAELRAQCDHERLRAEWAEKEVDRLTSELKVTDELLAERQRVLDAIPECEPHGACVPNALEWIEFVKKSLAESEALRVQLRIVSGMVSLEPPE